MELYGAPLPEPRPSRKLFPVRWKPASQPGVSVPRWEDVQAGGLPVGPPPQTLLPKLWPWCKVSLTERVSPQLSRHGWRDLPRVKLPLACRCKVCPLTFFTKSEMQIHSKSHTEAKPHKCPHCSKSFANASYLAQHLRIHLGVKPYHCSYCDKSFRQLSHLQQHTR